ncbi:DnaD domain protein [SAR202 cluster bacterium AD-804-J14_MRT_500m]|nr:DnaD domain protein [SAR202 cluster bacterium AD-804-J14_MRT_500m]
MKPPTFPNGTSFTPVPDPLLGTMLSSMDDLCELKCILRALWHINRMKGHVRYVTLSTLTHDSVLSASLDTTSVQKLMSQATQKGIFAKGLLNETGTVTEAYVLNTQSARQTLAQAKDNPALSNSSNPNWELLDEKIPDRPNAYRLYESNIGMITPLIADELKDAEAQYPQQWLEEAIAIAVKSNQRNWRYIAAILRRWSSEGKDDGKSRRHSKTHGPDRYLEEYIRRRGKLPGI